MHKDKKDLSVNFYPKSGLKIFRSNMQAILSNNKNNDKYKRKNVYCGFKGSL